MDTLDYWTPEDALSFRCAVADVGTLKPSEVCESDLRTLALAYAPRAMRNLARISEGDGKPALEAARLILAYAYPAPPPALPSVADAPPDSGALPPPPWLDQSSRLNYQSLDSSGIDDCLGNDRGLN